MELGELIKMLAQGTLETLYMTLVSTLFAYIVGLPIALILLLTRKDGLLPQNIVYQILNFIVNSIRSVPFLILLIAVIPFTTWVVGRSYGSTATIVPLVIASAPYVARVIEASLLEVDQGVVEAAQSMGASPLQIMWKVLLPEARSSLLSGATISLGAILGYSAMAGIIGGGGLGDIAIRFGYYRYQTGIMFITVVLLSVLVQVIQAAGMRLARASDKRLKE